MKILLVNQKITVILLMMTLLLIYGLPDIGHSEDAAQTVVQFSDRTLAVMVRVDIAIDSRKVPNYIELLEMPEAEALKIPKAELTKLVNLSANYDRTEDLRLPLITDLTGLEHATQLRTISLVGQNVIDLTPLSQLTQLTDLNFWDNEISDLTPLAQLTQLTELVLFGNRITDIAPLAQLTRLTRLWLSTNEISNLTPLVQLTQLTDLLLSRNEISDLTPLAQLTRLTRLALVSNEISDLTPLAQLTQLTELDLDDNHITNFAPLTQLSHLKSLGLGFNQIRDINSIAQLKQLTILYLSYNQIRDVTPLAQLTESLTELHLRNNQVRDVAPLAQLTYLEKLNLENNQIIDVTPLAQLTYLEELNLKDNRIRDVAPLAQLIHLRELKLRGNPIADTAPLSPLLDENPDLRVDIEVIREERGSTPTVTVSTPQPLTVATLNGSVVILTLSSGEFELRGEIRDAVTISGVTGITFDWTDIERVSDTEARIELTFDGTIDADTTLTVTVGSGAIKNYTGPAQTAEIPVSAATETPPQLEEDINRDGVVNVLDLILVAGRFGQSGQSGADINGDGIVNLLDLVLVAGAFGNAAAAPSSDPQALSMLSAIDVEGWLAQAQGLHLTDATSQRGVLFLEQLLATLTPQETALLPNYPNPFNPETWMPYRLAEDAFVTLTIYNGSGQVVRTLDVGHQGAAVYENRSKAIYWDGKNEFGGSVASGVYFYTLTAGDYSATRKMLILK